jgi:tetratricopeptide (TPR) repeat protein
VPENRNRSVIKHCVSNRGLPASLLMGFLICCGGCQTPMYFNRNTANPSRQWTSFGMDAFYTGKLSQAKAFFARAATENPTDYSAQVHLSRTLKEEQDYPAAIVHLQKGIELSGQKDTQLIAELGEIYLLIGDLTQAIEQAELAASVNHHCAATRVLQGKILMQQGSYDAALSEFQRAISHDPSLTDVQYLIAEVYQLTNQPLRAMSAIEQLLAQFPLQQPPERALLAKGTILLSMQQPHAAIEILQVACERETAGSEIFFRLSQAQLMAGKPAQARTTLIQAQEKFPELAPQLKPLIAQLDTPLDQMAIR